MNSLRALFLLSLLTLTVSAADYSADFETDSPLPDGWASAGDVAVDAETARQGKRSLRLQRKLENVNQPCSATGAAFAVQPGLWRVGGACRVELVSPDSSFNGVVILECLDAEGRPAERFTVSDMFGVNGWNGFGPDVIIPPGSTSARFIVQMNKAHGRFWVDELRATRLGDAPALTVSRVTMTTGRLGNLIYPDDPRDITLTLLATAELPAEKRRVTFGVADYWGAEQIKPVALTLSPAGKQEQFFAYTGTVSLKEGAPLAVGKFYQLTAEIPDGDRLYRNRVGLAILPEAAANAHPAGDIPFSGRNWDGRVGETFDLSHRLGIRVMNIWSGWKAEPPYTPHAPCIELARKYNMGVIFGVPTHAIENRHEGWDKYDEKSLREGTRNLLATYAQGVAPVYVSLGNEPPVNKDWLAADVEAYRVVYEAVKAFDPNLRVISTSIGAQREFFDAGFWRYCDIFDFHTYEDADGVARNIKNYGPFFKEHGISKPVWSTELGLNSQGMALHAVAADMVRKFAIFFAAGGANMSWFNLFYPDKSGKISGSSEEAHNVFDARYLNYNPKLTAVAYYHLVNSILVKKFVEERQYDNGARAFLLRDADHHALQVLWLEKGREDVFVPLPGVGLVEVRRLDGERRVLNATGKGVTLTVSQEPLMLLYDGEAGLAGKLGNAPWRVENLPASIVRGGLAEINIVHKEVSDVKLHGLETPPFWEAGVGRTGGAYFFTVSAPADTAAREAALTVTLDDADGRRVGELYVQLPVTAQVSARLAPVSGAVALELKNNGDTGQTVQWDLALTGQHTLRAGNYHREPTTGAKLLNERGESKLAPRGEERVIIPLADTDPLTVYQVRAQIRDESGAVTVSERNMGGFIGVPRAAQPPKLDGTLGEADWQRAPVQNISEARQYFSFDKTLAQWKGVDDLSAKVRFLWDENFLYVAVEVTDDIAGGLQQDGKIWMQDGLQFLVDPCRDQPESVGKYDYAVAVSAKGLQAWSYLSADAGAPVGEARDIRGGCQRGAGGSLVYELAIPWSRLAPFKPAAGRNLGLTLILNEDDGKGRKSFMTWFGNAHTKQVDTVADLILQ